jgi:hypothetical protein
LIAKLLKPAKRLESSEYCNDPQERRRLALAWLATISAPAAETKSLSIDGIVSETHPELV